VRGETGGGGEEELEGDVGGIITIRHEEIGGGWIIGFVKNI